MNESLFSRTVRAFFSSFATVFGIALAIVLVSVLSVLILGSNYIPPKTEITFMPNAEGDRTPLIPTTPAVLRIDIHGIIGSEDLTTEKFENLLLDSREGLLRGNRIKAIILHINSPGGSATDSDSIYRALLAYKAKYQIPIYAYVDGLCASGGFYIACAADKIYAAPSSVIGSIGVRMGPNFNLWEAMNKVGISALTLTAGKDKDALNPYREWQPGEEASLKAIITSLYDRFVSIVTSTRPIPMNKLVEDYGAHVFIAEKAKELGYVDASGIDYSEALNQLVKTAKLETYQVVQLKWKRTFLESLSQTKEHLLQWPLDPSLKGKPLYLYQP